ncbi:uncharacterized 2Fe-2S/4Fe-4S cluster protein (DUF4445 family) [Anaerosolibacter carboniphilus]|uniref:Uncharacterized 2Fe-2S/4Fe-4S cluster protein (DUF4445 family) n=1 Tax=Anaerosolibacter carboniphilus TaxID=1417629 RepID=A0A841L634_9FIRM|nr:ASKHA domain-containing protein [Anaerosolibacter carboniphilus]MBB6218552.1 uncharacterized 2Fe-2S/4Fe-4S cluster protein (DUF4445 family) [Anaerosolibacter carboniphilus]
MIQIHFINENRSIEAEIGEKLIDCIRRAGLALETPCNCIGVCGKCRVKAWGELSSPSAEEQKLLMGQDGIRLACLAEVRGNAEIELLHRQNELKTINRGYAVEIEPNSPIQRIELPKIDRKSPIPYEEYVGYPIEFMDLYEKIGNLEKRQGERIFGIISENRLIDIGEDLKDILGIAVDIGTTGISAYLVDMETGEVLNKVSCLNPQSQYGGDVLTRISYCKEHETGSKRLKELMIDCINEIVMKLLADQYHKDAVYQMMIAGNTTMLHLFWGIDPTTISKAPYRPIFLKKIDIKPEALSIQINRGGRITLLPSASGYVGGDILAGIGATAFDERKDTAIFIDIGTNGEIVAIANGRMAATSTAAGPALEGMNISCGCRAEAGAIDSFCIDENDQIHYSTIGDLPPKGICGSGLIDIAGSLVRKEIVLSNGKFNPDIKDRMEGRLRDKKFYITDTVYISQSDIRQIQLAKGAIATGVTMLLKEIGVSIAEVKEAVIAGAFGYHLNSENIQEIGLIPKGFMGTVSFVGNSSVEGARLALINKEMLEKLSSFREKMEVLELSMKEEFQNYFVKELKF